MVSINFNKMFNNIPNCDLSLSESCLYVNSYSLYCYLIAAYICQLAVG